MYRHNVKNSADDYKGFFPTTNVANKQKFLSRATTKINRSRKKSQSENRMTLTTKRKSLVFYVSLTSMKSLKINVVIFMVNDFGNTFFTLTYFPLFKTYVFFDLFFKYLIRV